MLIESEKIKEAISQEIKYVGQSPNFTTRSKEILTMAFKSCLTHIDVLVIQERGKK